MCPMLATLKLYERNVAASVLLASGKSASLFFCTGRLGFGYVWRVGELLVHFYHQVSLLHSGENGITDVNLEVRPVE